MNDDNIIVSGFDSTADAAALTVDFALARPLLRSGSTCDAYECTVQRRRVFVKRLKAEYRANPLYRAAFDKEYDLGVSLSHPSLPRYVSFGGDYIVMDFIEGDTLADLINHGDRRLKNRKFIHKLLLELVDVLEYLHRRHIVHCDVKADNIIISPYDDRPVTLIDLDKAYTSWLDSTHGNAQKYGCEDCADGAVDFHGLGVIAEELGVPRIAKVCVNDRVSAESVRKALKNRSLWLRGMLMGGLAGLSAAIFLWYFNGKDPIAEEAVIGAEVPQIVKVDTPPPVPVESEPLRPFDEESYFPEEEVFVAPVKQPDFDVAWLSAMVASKTEVFGAERERIYKLLESDTITASVANMELWAYKSKVDDSISSIYEAAKDRYPDIRPALVMLEVHNTEPWGWRTRKDDELLAAIRAYIKTHTTR